MQVTITKEKVAKAYAIAPKELQPVLKALFEDAVETKPVNIKERVKTFADVLELCHPSPVEQALLDYNGNEGNMIRVRAFLQLQLISSVLNEGWKPDWNNQNQYKYVPWFNEGGSGLSLGVVALWRTSAFAGSRLCYKSKELAEFAATQFADIYKEFLTLN